MHARHDAGTMACYLDGDVRSVVGFTSVDAVAAAHAGTTDATAINVEIIEMETRCAQNGCELNGIQWSGRFCGGLFQTNKKQV